MKDAHPHGPLEGHDRAGYGGILYCPRVFGQACESCLCQTPCKDAYDAYVITEVIRHGKKPAP